jgi:hypothetical protein
MFDGDAVTKQLSLESMPPLDLLSISQFLPLKKIDWIVSPIVLGLELTVSS